MEDKTNKNNKKITPERMEELMKKNPMIKVFKKMMDTNPELAMDFVVDAVIDTGNKDMMLEFKTMLNSDLSKFEERIRTTIERINKLGKAIRDIENKSDKDTK